MCKAKPQDACLQGNKTIIPLQVIFQQKELETERFGEGARPQNLTDRLYDGLYVEFLNLTV